MDLWVLELIRSKLGPVGLSCYVGILAMTHSPSCVIDFLSAKKASRLKREELLETIDALNKLGVTNWRFPRKIAENGQLIRDTGNMRQMVRQ